MSTPANVVPLHHAPSARRPVAHASLGTCTDCGSERLRPLIRTGRTVPEAVQCETCGLVLSIEEHTRIHAVVEGVPTDEELAAEIDAAFARTKAKVTAFPQPRDSEPLAGFRKGWDR